jgi:glycosyltransferase involved in cell wall biosynthesis
MSQRILIFAMTFPPAGVGTGAYAHALARGLTRGGVEVQVLAPRGVEAEAFDQKAGFSIQRFNSSAFVPWRYVQARAQLSKLIRSFKPDCVWATNGMSTRVAGLMDCWRDIPLITSMRGSDVTTRLASKGMAGRIESVPQRRAYEQSAAIASVSRFVRGVATAQGIAGEKIFVHPPAFDDMHKNKYRFNDKKFFAQYPQLKDRQIVLSVARLVKQKRVDKALGASGRLLKEFPDLVHIVVGAGPERGELERIAYELGWGERVFFTGAVEPMSKELFDFYSAADIFILPSVREGMGNVFIEAGAFALPCLAAADGGVPEIVADGETGMLARVDDVEDMSAKLRQLLKNGERTQKMGEKARQRVLSQFSSEAMTERAVEVLDRVVSNG